MNFYDVLAAKNWSGGIPTINFFDLLFAQSMGGGEQWKTYEGTLPATFNANGDNMRQYQVWGDVSGVGDRTVQLFDKNDPDVLMGYEIYNGEIRPHSYWFITGYIPVEQGQYYSKKMFGQNILGYNQSKEKVSDNASLSPIENGISFIRLNALKENINSAMFTKGSTPPASFVPFGYKLDMSVSDGTSSTTTPIYIGDDPLGKDEYVDYQAGKIYRRAANLFNGYFEQGTTASGVPKEANNRVRSNIIAAVAGAFCVDFKNKENFDVAFDFWNGSALVEATSWLSTKNYTTPNNATGVRIKIRKSNDAPFTPTEVVDFGMYSGYAPYLQPTDPPVALPALPTCEGTTIVDYAGSGTAPEKVVLEYKKGGKQP